MLLMPDFVTMTKGSKYETEDFRNELNMDLEILFYIWNGMLH
jgi:hypothetical protein